MPYKTLADKREYQREWCHQRRVAWLLANGPCVECGTWLDLHVHHKDPDAKSEKIVWSRSLAPNGRLTRELAKCEVRCHDCHVKRHHQLGRGFGAGTEKWWFKSVREITVEEAAQAWNVPRSTAGRWLLDGKRPTAPASAPPLSAPRT